MGLIHCFYIYLSVISFYAVYKILEFGNSNQSYVEVPTTVFEDIYKCLANT